MCCGKADEEQTGHWHALVEHGPRSAGRRGFLALQVMFLYFYSIQNLYFSAYRSQYNPGKLYKSCSRDRSPLPPFFFLPSFPTSSHLLLDAWVDLD